MATTQTFDLSTARCRDEVFSQNYGGYLTVVGLSFGHVSPEAVLSGEAKPVEARLSADGHAWLSAWHAGPTSGEAVYVERHTAQGCAFHGFVDSVSRSVVQVG